MLMTAPCPGPLRVAAHPVTALVLLLPLAACEAQAPGTEGGAGEQARIEDPSDYVPDAASTQAPTPLDAAQLAEGTQGLVAYLHRQDPLFYHDIWTLQFWSNQGGDCPLMQEHNGQDYWNDRCTTPDGTEYVGWTLNLRGGRWTEPESNFYMAEFAWLSGHAVLRFPDGRLLQNFGDVMYQEVEESSPEGVVHAFQGFVYGDFLYTGDEAAGTWVQEPVTSEIYYRYATLPGGSQVVELHGAIGRLPGPVSAARLENLRLSNGPGDCALEPGGSLRLRGPDGDWTTVAFGAAGPDDAACDGCGDALREDEEVGPVCADFSPLLSWPGGHPWER
jgi:hypothetical protein